MNGGIDQLVDTYKGNPQPLAANLQQAQKQQPPGSIPADLEEAIALQKIAELRNAFANQQAMQAGGAQQTVMDKLKQIVGGMQAQAQPAVMPQQMVQRPVMAARGGSIDHLVSNLGTNYARGGIIAFSKATEENNRSLVDDPDEAKAKQREADRRALLGFPAALADIVQLPVAAGYNLAADTGTGLERFLNRVGSALTGENINTQTDDQVGNKFRFSPTPFTDMLRAPTSREMQQKQQQQAAVANDPETQKLINLAASRAQTGQNTNPDLQPNQAAVPPAPRPNAGIAGANGAGGGGGATKEAVDPTSLRGITEAYLRGELGINPDTERDKAVDWTRKTLGLDALLAEKQGRIDSREKAIAGLQAARTPEWVKGLQSLSRGPIRGGVGMVLGQLGAGTVAAREEYEAQDMKYRDELDRLRDVITDAKIKGNYELAKEGMAAYKEVDARRRAAAQSTTSLLNTDQQAQASLQRAREAAASRNQFAEAQLEEKKARRLQQQQQFLAQEERKWQDTLSKNPDYKSAIDQRSMQERLLYMSTDPKVQEKAQENIDRLNEKIQKMLPTSQAGTVNIPPPPKDAVKRIG